MRKYKVRTREVSYKEYIVWAKDEESLNAVDSSWGDGDEYGYDCDITEVEKIYDEADEDEGAIEYCDRLKDDRMTGDLPE